jgi:hypothetical protein
LRTGEDGEASKRAKKTHGFAICGLDFLLSSCMRAAGVCGVCGRAIKTIKLTRRDETAHSLMPGRPDQQIFPGRGLGSMMKKKKMDAASNHSI